VAARRLELLPASAVVVAPHDDRGQGSQGDADVQAAPRYEALQEQLVDHERRLQALEDDSARRQAASRDARE
jgi:hypothetical protein